MNILIAGDYYPCDRVASLVEEEKYNDVFSEVIQYTTNVDLAIVNLEAPIVKSTFAKPIKKCGPNLRCTYKAIDALKYVGFKMVTLANNHLYDFGEEGLRDTLETCKNSNIAVVGAGINLADAAKTRYQEINGKTLAIINCCEHEFSIATDTTGGCNPLNPIQQFYAIQEARRHADFVIIIVHGGHEHFQLPSPRMKETYRFFVDAGADAVVNHHQHCYSGYEIYNGKPIFYGLGNFSFNRDNKKDVIWNEGIMVLITLTNTRVNFELIPYLQGYKDTPGVRILKDKIKFMKLVEKLNKIIANDNLLRLEHEKWMEENSKMYLLAFEPYTNRYLKALYVRGLLPSLINKAKKYRLLNIIECEAHLDRTLFALKNKI